MIDIVKIRIRILGDDGNIRTIILNEDCMPIYYSGYAKDFRKGKIRIINKNATAQELLDDVDELVHVPWD